MRFIITAPEHLPCTAHVKKTRKQRQQRGHVTADIHNSTVLLLQPSTKNGMDASYAMSRSLALLISHVHSDL